MESQPNCSICRIPNKTNAPVVWCPICSESLCSSCEQQHRVMKLSKDHVTISYEDYCKLPPFIRNVDLNCHEHNERYQYFCRLHDVPCCLKCLSKSHKKCADTPVIDDIVRNVKSSSRFEDVWNELEETYDAYNVSIETGQNNLREIKIKKKEFAKRIKKRTNKLIDQLRTIENQTLSALDSAVTEKADKIKIKNKTLRLTLTNLKTMIGHETSIKTHTSDYQVFIGIKHIENEIRKSKENLQKIVDDGGFNKWEVGIEENDTIEDVIFGVKSFGEVQMIKVNATLPFNVTQPNRAQIMVKRDAPQLKLVQQFQLDTGDYSGCCTLRNGLMVFADSANDNEEVKITQGNGCIKSRVKFTGNGVDDVTAIDDNHIAVSNPRAKTISLIAVDSGEIIKTLKTKRDVGGITHHDGYIHFCEPDNGIMKINVETEKVESVRDDESVDFYSRIDTNEKRLCYTSYGNDTVTVLDSDYKLLFTYHNEKVLCAPMGVAFDKYQNIFVCSFGNDRLLLISREVDDVKSLVTETNEFEEPTSVHFCLETNLVFVVSEKGEVRKYSLH